MTVGEVFLEFVLVLDNTFYCVAAAGDNASMSGHAASSFNTHSCKSLRVLLQLVTVVMIRRKGSPACAGVLDEKASASQVLGSYPEHTGALYAPHIQETLSMLLKMGNYFHCQVREQAHSPLPLPYASTSPAFPAQPSGPTWNPSHPPTPTLPVLLWRVHSFSAAEVVPLHAPFSRLSLIAQLFLHFILIYCLSPVAPFCACLPKVVTKHDLRPNVTI